MGLSAKYTLSAINSWLNENGYPPTNIITKDIIKRIYIHIPTQIRFCQKLHQNLRMLLN